MNTSLPPSPALSACDSLADIDDLDAFLEAQGPLSRFATPPLKATTIIDTIELMDEDLADIDDLDASLAFQGPLSRFGTPPLKATATTDTAGKLEDLDSLGDSDDLDAFLAAEGPLSRFATPPLKAILTTDTVEILDDVDSLPDTDDLDAFLTAQGPLSRFATPPLKAGAVVETVEVPDVDDEDCDDEDCDDEDCKDEDCDDCEPGFSCPWTSTSDEHVAFLFAHEASNGGIATQYESELLHHMLLRAQLPPEVLALSYSILSRYSAIKFFGQRRLTEDAELLTVSALILAVTYTSDHPPRTSWWSGHVCDAEWPARQIDEMVLRMLATLDWSLHSLSSPQSLLRSMTILFPLQPTTDPTTNVNGTVEMDVVAKLQPHTLSIDAASARWACGQLTPDATPPCSAVELAEGPFLRLL